MKRQIDVQSKQYHTVRFAHLASTTLKVGDTVNRGDIIAQTKGERK